MTSVASSLLSVPSISQLPSKNFQRSGLCRGRGPQRTLRLGLLPGMKLTASGESDLHRRTLWDLCFERTLWRWGAEGGTYPYDHVFCFVQDTLGSGLGQAASCLLIILTLNYI